MNLNNPDFKIKLPKELKEISGLTALPNNQLAAVQDEKGILFVIYLPSGEMARKIKFNRKGDYEGLCSLNNLIYIVDSSGNITELNINTEKSKTYSTELNHKNNIEGLCVHPSGENLLLALKGHSELTGNNKTYSSIFSFDLHSKSIEPTPFLTIETKAIELQFGIKLKQPFAPSGICYWNRKYLILSHRNCALAIYSQEKRLLDYIKLDRKIFSQPEGICVANNMLFICNEGKKKPATILGFKLD